MNYLAREIVARGAIDAEYVDQHCVYAAGGPTSATGCARRPSRIPRSRTRAPSSARSFFRTEASAHGRGAEAGDAARRPGARRPAATGSLPSTSSARRSSRTRSTSWPRSRADAPTSRSTSSRPSCVQFADLYSDRARRVVSFWTMGFNQHTRGTWVNEQAYMVHLLTGKYAKPGNGAFSLTGQPSACGTTREVGTFAHRLPADMGVDDPERPAATPRRSGGSRRGPSTRRSASTSPR